MTRQFRVVRYVDTTRHRVVRHPTIPKTKPGGGNLGGESIRDKLGLGEGMSLQDFIAGLGLGIHTPPSPTMGPNGPTSSYFSPVGPGTRPGAFLDMSSGGRILQALIGGGYENFGGMNPFGMGGPFYGRGMASDWTSQGIVGEGPDMGDNKSIWSLMKDWQDAKDTLNTDMATYQVLQAAGYFARNPREAAAADAGIALDRQQVDEAWQKLDARASKDAHAAYRWASKWIGGGSDPDPDWVISPAVGAGPGAWSGRYPTVVPAAGRMSRLAAAAALRRLVREQKWGSSAPWWNNQWLYSPRASASGTGGGTSMAPESILGGRKHPYDWVALRRSVG